MRIISDDVVFVPPIEKELKARITRAALDQVARRLERANPGGAAGDIAELVVEMPIPMRKVLEGYYTEQAAANFLANKIIEKVLPLLGEKAEAAKQEDVLSRTVTYGAEEGFKPGGGPPINVDYLRKVGLEPKWSMEVRGVRYHVSDPFQVGKRVAFVAFVEEGGVVHTRVFYSSGSQGVWRAASHRVELSEEDKASLEQKFPGKDPHGDLGIPRPHWIGKGQPHEESTDLPWQLYSRLSDKAKNPRKEFSENESEGIFYGLLEKEGLQRLLAGKVAPDAGFHPEDATSIGSFSQTVKSGRLEFGVPETFQFNDPKDKPDFSKVLDQFTVSAASYGGNITGYVFGSLNGKLAWLFYRDSTGRSWVGAIQSVESSITARGAFRQVIDAGNLSMPAYEYQKQVPSDYRGAQATTDPEYYDAWAYIRRLPFMAELYQSQGWTMPASHAPIDNK